MKKNAFENWLVEKKRLKPSSVRHYVGAINSLSRASGVDLFNTSDAQLIDEYYEQYGFKEKDATGNRMYISGVKHFKEFLKEINVSNELIIESVNYEANVKHELNNIDSVPRLSYIPQSRPKYKKVSKQKIWERNPRLASEVIQAMNFRCEGNPVHDFFISNRTKRNYVEAHHLIPMEYQDDFEYSLDVHANIVSLCPVCHKKVHHGTFEEIIELVGNLYAERKIQLQKSNINISFDELSSLYK
ncbi:HNH endonuclease [Marinococcus luteus]|uniref:HNH endonuclease n=1 Tax=Marinococcus luteus TaxID=1122204 RepID=UPI002ACC8F0B|nr:hypothetical protein [Marinococcus luteus]MDZ5781885.1 hypothetical protein [Marinococcus luteus]